MFSRKGQDECLEKVLKVLLFGVPWLPVMVPVMAMCVKFPKKVNMLKKFLKFKKKRL